jgi:hypothetical protein
MGILLYIHSNSMLKVIIFLNYSAITNKRYSYSYGQKHVVLILTVNSNRLHKCMLKIPFTYLQKLYVKLLKLEINRTPILVSPIAGCVWRLKRKAKYM